MKLYNPEYDEWEDLSEDEVSDRIRFCDGSLEYYNLEYGEWFDASDMIKM